MNDEFGNPIIEDAPAASGGADEFGNAVIAEAAPETQSSVLSKAGQVLKTAGLATLRGLDWLSHLGQPQAAKDLVQAIAADPKSAPTNPEQAGKAPGFLESLGTMMPGQGMPTMPAGMDIRPAASSAVDMATSPSTYVAPALGAVSKIPWVASMLSKVGRVPEAAATGIASKLTHIPGEALTEASTPAGRAAMASAMAQAPEQVKKLVETANNARTFMPEAERVSAAVAKAPDIDIGPTLKAFDEAMPKTLGPMDAATPGIMGLRNKIQAYKAAVQGRLPSAEQIAEMDFAGNLEEAKAALADPESKWGVLSDIAAKADSQATKAASQAERAGSKASKAAANAGKTKKEFIESADMADKNVTRYGRARNEAGATAESALEKAQEASTQAREAFANAKAKAATGEITAADAQAAEREMEGAKHYMHMAEAANEFAQGKTLDEVSRILVDRHGLSGDALTDALKKGRMFVADNSFTPAPVSSKMSAADFKRLREALDKDIDFNAPDYKSLKGALKVPRDQMKKALIEAVGPEYADDMEAWSKKIDAFNELNGRLGKSPSNRLNRAQTLLNGHEKIGNAELLDKIDEITGGGFRAGAKAAKTAAEFGPTGIPSWMPAAHPATMMVEAGAGTFMAQHSGHPLFSMLTAAGAAAGSSPQIAARAINASRLPPYLLRLAAENSPALSAAGAASAHLPPYLQRPQ